MLTYYFFLDPWLDISKSGVCVWWVEKTRYIRIFLKHSKPDVTDQIKVSPRDAATQRKGNGKQGAMARTKHWTENVLDYIAPGISDLKNYHTLNMCYSFKRKIFQVT